MMYLTKKMISGSFRDSALMRFQVTAKNESNSEEMPEINDISALSSCDIREQLASSAYLLGFLDMASVKGFEQPRWY